MIDRKYKVIFWDFDGVLMNSNEIRDLGFVRVLSDYSKQEIDQLLKYHQKNGGLSRYVKFRYFFEEVLGENISEDEIYNWSEKFSVIMKELLVDESLLINETIQFVKKEYENREMHIVSGSDQSELRYICKQLDIAKYFDSINGSPTSKNELVESILKKENYSLEECVLVGDSVNDKVAAKINDIKFMGYNYKE
jgi:phosphoglycolate phosphatase-like HAD superfamily hydrolase